MSKNLITQCDVCGIETGGNFSGSSSVVTIDVNGRMNVIPKLDLCESYTFSLLAELGIPQ